MFLKPKGTPNQINQYRKAILEIFEKRIKEPIVNNYIILMEP
jgi:hypothetical protein